MDFGKMSFFAAAKQRMGWINQRQRVLSENIANSDTPEYRPRDLKPMEFRDMVRGTSDRLHMASTDAGRSMGPREGGNAHRANEERMPYETAPAGNAVVLEEQMIKMSQTQLDHQLTNKVYSKQLGMIRTALGK